MVIVSPEHPLDIVNWGRIIIMATRHFKYYKTYFFSLSLEPQWYHKYSKGFCFLTKHRNQLVRFNASTFSIFILDLVVYVYIPRCIVFCTVGVSAVCDFYFDCTQDSHSIIKLWRCANFDTFRVIYLLSIQY